MRHHGFRVEGDEPVKEGREGEGEGRASTAHLCSLGDGDFEQDEGEGPLNPRLVRSPVEVLDGGAVTLRSSTVTVEERGGGDVL